MADLYKRSALGRPTVPARVLATVTLLQSFEGLSDREACDRLEVDLRWQAAAGVSTGAEGFHPTVLVGLRNRLRASDRPRRLFEDTKVVARQAGTLKGRARVLDSTPVYDALSALVVLNGQTLSPAARDTADLLALVAGQDVAEGDDGVFRIVRGVAKDRVISTVDPEARHGHKSRNRRFDGYKAHTSIDPGSELIDEVVLTPANASDRDAVDDLLCDHVDADDKPTVLGDSAYADGATRERLEEEGFEVLAKTPPVRNSTGGFTKDRFAIDPVAGTATCPAEHTVAIQFGRYGGGKASFAPHCGTCPLRADCTRSARGRTITVHPQEALLRRARAEQASLEWQERYRADRPIVERKIAHLMRRAWGGRRARTRGRDRVATDVDTRAGAVNLARLAVLGPGLRPRWLGPRRGMRSRNPALRPDTMPA